VCAAETTNRFVQICRDRRSVFNHSTSTKLQDSRRTRIAVFVMITSKNAGRTTEIWPTIRGLSLRRASGYKPTERMICSHLCETYWIKKKPLSACSPLKITTMKQTAKKLNMIQKKINNFANKLLQRWRLWRDNKLSWKVRLKMSLWLLRICSFNFKTESIRVMKRKKWLSNSRQMQEPVKLILSF
jgi:hypothetical protein